MGNSPTSRVFLWLMYSRFNLETEEYKEALRWYRLAGEIGHKDAQFNLGLMYETGLGVSLDYKEAVKWYTLSAEQRVSKAQLYLGHLYVVGNGVMKNYVQAHMWFNISGKNAQDEGCKNRDIIEREMTLDSITEAKKLAREWMEKNK